MMRPRVDPDLTLALRASASVYLLGCLVVLLIMKITGAL